MSLLGIFQRTSPTVMPSSADEIIWGVRRKYGYNEIDDPSVHRGLEQHAFTVRDYGVAMCGAKSYGWRKPRHIRLAVPTEENPACRKCSMAIAFEVSEAVSVDRLMEMTTPVDRERIEKALIATRRKALTAGTPLSIEEKRHQYAETHLERRMHNWPVKDFSQAA